MRSVRLCCGQFLSCCYRSQETRKPDYYQRRRDCSAALIEPSSERLKEIKKTAKPVTEDMIAQVGAIAANGDETVGKLIAEAMQKVGKDGVITVEESKTIGSRGT